MAVLIDLAKKVEKVLFLKDIIQVLDIHVSEAQRLLDESVNNDQFKELGMKPSYHISVCGNDQVENDEVLKVFNFKMSEKDDLNELKKDPKVIACKVNGIICKDIQTINSLGEVKPFLTAEDLVKQQKLSYILNDQIKIRKDLAERYQSIHGKSIQDEKAIVKEEKKPPTPVKKVKQEVVEKKPLTSSKNNPKQASKNKAKAKTRSKASKVKEPTPERSSDPFSEEDTTDSPIKKTSKRRRIEIFDDSDDEVPEAKPPTPVSSPKKQNITSGPRMESVLVTEETIDEDGYINVKKVQKLIPSDLKGVQESKPALSDKNNKNNKRDSEDQANPGLDEKKRNSKKQKVDEDDEPPTKSKQVKGKSKLPRGQVSITSFFKPSQN